MKKTIEKTESELGMEVSEQYKLAKNYLDPIHQKMNLQEELYRSFIDPSNSPTGARVFDPRVFRVIETITPRMVSNEPVGSFYPAEEGDMAVSHILNVLLRYDWNRAEMFPKLVMLVKSMLIFGTAFGRTYWDFRETEKTRMVPKNINGRMVWSLASKEKIKITEFDGPNFEPLNIYDCFFDPNATSLANMRWFIYRRFRTLDELKAENDTRGIEYFKNLDKLEEAYGIKHAGGTTASAMDNTFREHRRLMLGTQEFIGKDESNKDIVILTRYTKDGWVDMVPEYGNLIIRETENPFFHGELPIIYAVDYPYPNELLGMGEIEPIDRVQRAINAVLNQRLNNVQLTLNTMWKVRKGSGTDIHTLVSAPGNIITTNEMNGVEPIGIPDVTGGTFVQTMNYLTSSLQNGSGITDYTMGINNQTSVANKTATGARLIQQEANAQFKLKIQLFSHMVIAKIANHWKDLRIQFTTDEQSLRIVGKTEIEKLLESTELAKTDFNGNKIVPGDFETPARLTIKDKGNFAFLKFLPEDIQPSIVGNYDFIPQISTEQITDQAVIQENFFTALDKITTPAFLQGLKEKGKTVNWELLGGKVFEQLHIPLDMNNVLTDMQPEGMPEQETTTEDDVNQAFDETEPKSPDELLPLNKELLPLQGEV